MTDFTVALQTWRTRQQAKQIGMSPAPALARIVDSHIQRCSRRNSPVCDYPKCPIRPCLQQFQSRGAEHGTLGAVLTRNCPMDGHATVPENRTYRFLRAFADILINSAAQSFILGGY